MLNQNDINISLIPKEVGKRPELRGSGSEAIVAIVNRILSGLLFFCFAVWGGLYWYKEYRLTGELESRNQELQIAEREIRQKGNFDDIKKQNSVIAAATDLVKNHIYASNVFRFMEMHTHQDIRFSGFKFLNKPDLRVIEIGASVKAKSVDALAKQIIALSVTLDDILREGNASKKQSETKKSRSDTAAYGINFAGYSRDSDGGYSSVLSFKLPIDFVTTNLFIAGSSDLNANEDQK